MQLSGWFRQLVTCALGVGVLAFQAFALTACPADGPQPAPDTAVTCTTPFLGDKAKPPQLEIVARDVSGHAKVVRDGDDVAVVFPPQGGRVIFVGARITNIDACGVKLSGVLRDLASGQVRLDIRTVNLVPTPDGFGGTLDADISTFSNVPVCPNQWATDDVFDKPYQLEVTVTDKAGRTATSKVKVVPRCAEPERAAECRCICRKGYVLGESCGVADGGVDAGVDASADASESSGDGGEDGG